MSIVGGRLVTDKTPRTETFSPHLIFMLAVTMAGAAALPENVAAAHKYELSMYVRESVVQGKVLNG